MSCASSHDLAKAVALRQARGTAEEMSEHSNLHRAIVSTGTGTAELARLLRQGADPNATDPSGYTGLMTALKYNKTARALVLIEHGADPGRINSAGWSAFHWAASVGDEKVLLACAETLGREGADVLANELESPTRSGKTPKDLATAGSPAKEWLERMDDEHELQRFVVEVSSDEQQPELQSSGEEAKVEAQVAEAEAKIQPSDAQVAEADAKIQPPEAEAEAEAKAQPLEMQSYGEEAEAEARAAAPLPKEPVCRGSVGVPPPPTPPPPAQPAGEPTLQAAQPGLPPQPRRPPAARNVGWFALLFAAVAIAAAGRAAPSVGIGLLSHAAASDGWWPLDQAAAEVEPAPSRRARWMQRLLDQWGRLVRGAKTLPERVKRLPQGMRRRRVREPLEAVVAAIRMESAVQ